MTHEVRAVCFPSDDPVFVVHVRQLVLSPSPSEPLQAAIEAMLRETYPLAVISRRHPLASLDGQPIRYVYRDGALLPRPADVS